jgi:hypothetical protein
MISRYERGTGYISIRVALRRTDLTEEILEECVRREMIREPLTETDLVELRRIRRLRELGVNMPGIEIILQMRRRIQALQAEMTHEQKSGSRLAPPEWAGADRVEWIQIEERWQRLLPPVSDR